MSPTSLALLGPALLALAPAAVLADSSISCAGGIVSVGDAKLDLLAKCGRPTLQERRIEQASLRVRAGAGRRVTAPVELWTYDLGRSRFVQVVKLVAGKVAGVERGSHGYADEQARPERPRRAACDPGVLSVGKLKLDLLARCGEPATVDVWEEELRAVQEIGDHTVLAQSVTVQVELWTYDFGRNHLLRLVRLEDGRVTAVDTGSYGYAE
jgi:hypothetical protein